MLFKMDIKAKHFELRNSLEARLTEVYRFVRRLCDHVPANTSDRFLSIIANEKLRSSIRKLHSRVYVSKDLVHIALTAPAARLAQDEIELKPPHGRLRWRQDRKKLDSSKKGSLKDTGRDILELAVEPVKEVSTCKE